MIAFIARQASRGGRDGGLLRNRRDSYFEAPQVLQRRLLDVVVAALWPGNLKSRRARRLDSGPDHSSVRRDESLDVAMSDHAVCDRGAMSVERPHPDAHAKVMVFVPAPVLTVTIEQRDQIPDIHLHAGGQGVWQARMLAGLGVDVTLCAAVGGEVGVVLARLLELERVRLRLVAGQASSPAYVHDRRDGQRNEVAHAPGEALSRHDLDELYGYALAEGLDAGVCLLAGTPDTEVIRPHVYQRLTGDLRRNGALVLADLAGDYLTAVLAGGVDLLKVSHEELIDARRAADDSVAGLTDALVRLHHDGADAAVISRAGHPALALLEGRVFQVVAPVLEPADARGAGDSMFAGFAATLAKGSDVRTAVCMGAAAGAVNVSRHGLGTGSAEVIDRIRSYVRLEPVADATRKVTPQELADGVGHAT